MKSEQKIFTLFNSTHWFYIILVYLCMLLYSVAFAENRVEAERQNWEVFTNRSNIFDLLLSDDGKILWTGTNGGLEKRDASTGKIIKLFTNLDGLPDNQVFSLASDGDGGIWIGTWKGGLVHLKSNGVWNVFNMENSQLPYDSILSLLYDGRGGVWIGTYFGLAHFKADETWDVFDISNSGLSDNSIFSILSDGDNGIWIGTWGGGLVHFKSDDNWETFNKNNSELPDNTVFSLLSDGYGGLWIGTGGYAGLTHLKSNGNWETFNKNNSELPNNSISSLLSDSNGGVWIGTASGLTHFKSDGNWEVFNKGNSGLPYNSISSILSDTTGGLWIGTDDGLAHLKSDGNWEVLNQGKSGLPANNISSLISDENGGLWIGTGDIVTDAGGLAHFKANGNWEVFYNDNSGMRIYFPGPLLLDGSGGLWIGIISGLGQLKADGTWGEVFSKDNSGLPDNAISSILSDSSGGLWIGTDGGGLAHLKSDNTWKVFKYNSGLPDNHVNALLSDDRGEVWVGTYSGLGHLKSNGNSEVFNEVNSGLPANNVQSLLADGREGLWIGTGYGDLAHLKSDGNWEVFNNENSGIPASSISSILFDSNGGLWIGTGGGGLAHLKSDGYCDILFNTENSALPENSIKKLLSDDQGGLWIGTADGLAHFLQIGNPEQLIKPNSPEITINWFLKSSSLDYQNVKYIELQRSLSQDGVYETVLDASDKPVRFYADYSICPKPRVYNCWVTVEGHTPETRTNSDGSTTKGYTLNTPINDPEWLEGLPRYYRLSAVIEEDGKLVRVANNSEAALITPQVEEKPRVELTLDKNAVAMQPNQKAEITVFVSSLDLFRGDVELAIESGEGVTISDNTNTANSGIVETHGRASLRGSNASENDLSSTISLKAGETKPVLLTIDALYESTQLIKIIPKIQSGYSGKSTSLNVQVGNGTNSMIALSIAHKTKRSRVLDSLTISGNVIPAEAGRSVVISGNNIKKSVDSSNSSESAESLTLTTDENGYLQGTVTPIHAGLLTLTAKSNGITSNNAEIFILPSRTNIALSSNVNQSTKKGDILRVQGTITPVRLDGTKVNLDIRYLDPANQDAGLQPQFVGGVEIDENGVFYRDVVVPGNGFINVKASLPETSDYLSVNTKLVIPIGQPVGEGIILVSESGDADFQTISKSLGNYVYHALKSRNIPAERIKYLGLGGDKIIDDFKLTTNLATDNFGKTNKANLHDALTNWATTLFSTDDPYKTPLNLYLIGKVEDDKNAFRLNDSEVLTSDDLAKYLNEAEEIVKTNSKDNYSEYKGFPVTIILEGTQSGKWIEKIAGNGRIILTSSSDKGLDEGGFAGYDNLGESSFSRYFYQFVNYGYDIEGSFAEASYEILKFYRHKQRPVMDADGDGVGITTEYDRRDAAGKFIEYRPSGNLRPQIITTNPDRTIKRRIGVSSDESGDGSVSHFDDPILWAIAADPEEEMEGVFCSITDPSNKTVNIEMKRKFDNRNVYEIDLSQTYPNLATGCYHAVYYAKDKAGNVSLPEQKHLNVISSNADQGGGGVPNPPQFTISVDDDSSIVAVSWSEVANADGYKLFYCPYPDCPPADIGEIDMGNKREITFDGKGFAFYGAVKAYNSNGFSGWSNVEFFNLR